MQGPKALADALDIKWILREPCALSWTDPSLETRKLELGSRLTLWIGANPAERLWTVMVQKSILWEIAQRTISFDFFMFLNPHSFHVQNDQIPVADEVPAFLREAFPVIPKQGCIRAFTQQGQRQTAGHVLMQQQIPDDKPWDGMSLHLLMQFQSLSEAPKFDIYISNQINVLKVMNRIEHELPKSIPGIHINLSKAYEGRGGVWDTWGSYNDMLVPKQRAPRPRLLDSPPRYGKTLARTARNAHHVPSPREPTTPPSLKRAFESQQEGSLQKRVRQFKSMYPALSPTEENTPSTTRGRPSQQSTQDDELPQVEHAVQDDWIVQDDKSTQDGQSATEGQATYEKHPLRATEYSADQAQSSNLATFLSPLQDAQVPPYAASITSSESDQQLDIKSTIFTRGTRHHKPLALPLVGLDDLITAAVTARIPAIAAQVQQRLFSTEMTALAQTSIAEHISTHMPSLMQSHLSDLHDEWDSASASLHDTKDEAITDVHIERDAAIKEMQDESQTSYDDFKEKAENFRDDFFVDLEDKFTEFEDRSKARIDALPPQYTRDHGSGGRNSAKDAVRLFQRNYQGQLNPEQQVKVLLSIAKWNNAEVFMAAGAEMQEALVKHWAGVADYVSNSLPVVI